MNKCDWCGKDCDDRVQAIRHFKTTYITNGKAEVGEAAQKTLFFCNTMCRYYYFTTP